MKQYENGIIYYDENLPRHILRGKECVWWEKTVGTTMKVLFKKIDQIKYN